MTDIHTSTGTGLLCKLRVGARKMPTRLRAVSLALLYACLVTARLVHRGARKAASAALAQQAARHPGQAMELVRLIGARYAAGAAKQRGQRHVHAHHEVHPLTPQRVHAIVRVLQPPPLILQTLSSR